MASAQSLEQSENSKPVLFLKNVHPNSLERGQNYSFHNKPLGRNNYVGRPKRATFDGSYSQKTMSYDTNGNFNGYNGPPLPGPHTHATLKDENGYRGWMSTIKLDEPGKITEFQFKDLPDDVNKQINQYVGGKSNRNRKRTNKIKKVRNVKKSTTKRNKSVKKITKRR